MAPMIHRWCVWVLLALPLSAQAHAAPVAYVLNQHYATIGFTTSGLFSTQGYFQKFCGRMILDFKMPEHSSMDVTLDDRSISLSWHPGVRMLESQEYFDSQDFPDIRFHSISTRPGNAPGQYDIIGALTIRGVTRPQMMVARLLSAAPGTEKGWGSAPDPAGAVTPWRASHDGPRPRDF
jgi:polyisoprenoid-binding protein YceI